MIAVDKFKVGDTVWFDDGGKVESAKVFGRDLGLTGLRVYMLRASKGTNGAELLWNCPADRIYETKLDCLRAMWKDADTEKYNAMRLAMQRENLATKLADEIKAEEEKANKPKATIVKFDPMDTLNGVLVKLPSCIDVPVKDRTGDNPIRVRTDHFILTATSPAGKLVNETLLIYPATAHGFRLTYENRPYECCRIPGRRCSDPITIANVRTAVESLGFELAED